MLKGLAISLREGLTLYEAYRHDGRKENYGNVSFRLTIVITLSLISKRVDEYLNNFK
jgi:hypothetical protein